MSGTLNRRGLVSLLLAATLAGVAVGDENPPVVVAQLDWLSGTWSAEKWGGEFVAYYATPSEGRLLSWSQLHKGGKVEFHEFEVFADGSEGLTLTPHPGGSPAATFRLTKLDAELRRAVFENPENDFPTRIVYQRLSDDTLQITLSDPHHESDKVEEFTLTRVPF